MGMMINRRRYSGKKDPYIQDGLIFWFDGIWNKEIGLHDDNMLYLNDLTNNHQITWTGDVSFESKGAIFDKTVFASFNSDRIINAINDDKATVEILIKPVAKGKGGNSGYVTFGRDVRGFWVWDNSYAAIASFSYRKNYYNEINKGFTTPRYAFYMVLNNNMFVVHRQNDTITRIGAASKGIVNNNLCLIGALSSISDAANFVLYSIRVYDRILTQEELTYNFELDKKRFDLTFE